MIRSIPDKSDPLDNFKRAEGIAAQVVEFIEEKTEGDRSVVIEGLGFGARGDATRNLGGLQYLIITKLLAIGISPDILAPTSLKKKFTGSGKADKKAMVEAIAQYDPKFYERVSGIPQSKGKFD